MNFGFRLTAFLCLFALSTAYGQQGTFNFKPQLPKGFGSNLIGESTKSVTFAAEFEVASQGNQGRVKLTATIAKGYNIYSLTQPPGGPLPTRIELKELDGVTLAGDFTPDKKPKVGTMEIYKGIPIEKHLDKVVFTAPLKFEDRGLAAESKIELIVGVLACREGQCVPIDETVPAVFKGEFEAPKAAAEFRAPDSVVAWSATLNPAVVRPGDDAELVLTAHVDPEFHVYQYATSAKSFSTPIIVTKKSGVRLGDPKASSAPIKKESETPGLPTIFYHEDNVTWTLPVQIRKDAEPGKHAIEAFVGYQACTDTKCLLTRGLRLSGEWTIGDDRGEAAVALKIEDVPYRQIKEAAATAGQWVDSLTSTNTQPDSNAAPVATKVTPRSDSEASSELSIPLALGFGLLGGLILNLMPCVLPVIGLKVMSFVEQAGQERSRILALNLWYTLGLLSVFWVLAAVVLAFRAAYGESFAWGQQFTYFEFRLGLMIFVFAMALSFLGTWEIPLPGFATGSAAGDLQSKEGAGGAFAKGVFSTILATPCSGPFLGPVFGFMLTQSGPVVFSVFTAIGLGMAAPYLLIGAFPSLINALPKPGAWMETMKQGLSFLLLGTVVWLFYGTPDRYQPAVFGTLMAVWFGCWLIGRVPNWEAAQKRLTAWGTGTSMAVGLSLFMFYLMVPQDEKNAVIKWEPYSEARLASLQQEGKTVMLDFTAEWCWTCKLNYANVLNTASMAEILEQHDVVPMIADWSDRNEEIRAKLDELNQNSIPLLAIYPGDDPSNPIVLPDVLTENRVRAAIESVSGSAASSSSIKQVSFR